MGNLWNRLTQSLVSAGTMNARRPLVAWEASWEETEALLAGDKQRGKTGEAEQEQAGEVRAAALAERSQLPGVHLQTRQLTKRYGEREVLKQVQLDVQPGEFIAIVGRSGCGKSTLLRLVAGLEEASDGQVLAQGTPSEIVDNADVRRVYLGEHFRM